MGGFVDGRDILSLDDIQRLVQNGEIEYPIATREEIQDKSKGDAVTKALVVVQTTWFLLQCAARGSQHLALTELELATAAFALLNIIIYALWWDKPLDVQCRIAVRRKTARDGRRRQPAAESGVAPSQVRDDWARSLGWLQDAWDGLRIVFHGFAWMSVIRPFFHMMGADDDDDVDEQTFFVVGDLDDLDVSSVSAGILVTMVFGGIHCIAWSFAFPSPTEQLLWRISSIAITAIPLAFIGIAVIGNRLDDYCIVEITFAIPFFLLFFLYPISRILLLLLSLTTLRSLPPSAYQTVQWTTFIPHV